MTNMKTLLLVSVVAGLTAPVLAFETGNAPSDNPSDHELLYQNLKANNDEIPQWLVEVMFPELKDATSPAGNDAGREGGETTADAIAITSFPFTDTGNTSDNLPDYQNAAYAGTPLCPQVGSWYSSSGNGKDVVYSLTLGAPTTISASLCAAGGMSDTTLGIFLDNAGALGAMVARNEDAGSAGCPGMTLKSVIANCTLPAGSYFIVVDGYGTNAGAYTLSVSGPCLDPGCPPAYQAAFELEQPCLDTNGGCNMATPAFETIPLNTPLCGTTWADNNQRDTDWYEVVLAQSSTITVNMAANCVPMSAVIVNNACPPVTIASVNVAAGATATLTSVCQLPGVYRVVALPQSFAGFPCAGLNHYGIEVGLTSCVHPCDTYTCAPIYGSGSYFGDTTGKTNIAGNAAPDDFYCFTALHDCAASFSTCSVNTIFAPSNDTYLRLWSAGGPCGGGVQLATDDDGCDGLNGTPGLASVLTYSLVAGQSYVLQVEGYSSNAGVYELIVDSPCLTVEAHETPMAFALGQNVPNPFNPSTTIAYTTSETGFASLKVFDLAGATVATLVNGVVEAGSHSITFDASNLSSGVYFYTLEANGTIETKKMVLMK